MWMPSWQKPMWTDSWLGEQVSKPHPSNESFNIELYRIMINRCILS
jgi:hypothetical protein